MVRRILILLYDIGKRIYNKINKIFEKIFLSKNPYSRRGYTKYYTTWL